MATVIHNSMLRTLRQCEQKYTYEYIEGLGGDRSTALDIGTWFHLLMEAQGLRQGVVQKTLLHDLPSHLYFGLPPDEDPWVMQARGESPPPALHISDAWDEDGLVNVRKVHDWVCEEIHAFMPEGDDDIDEMPDNVWFLYERYMARHGAELVHEDVLGVEVQWQREDTYDAPAPLNGVVPYGGQADRIVRNADGLVVVRDHKTTSTKPSASFLLTDSQLHLYAWGVWPWLKEHGIERLHAVEYDFALTYWPSVRLTKAGNLYANQKTIDLHAASVLLAEALEERGEYDGGLLPEQFNEFLAKCEAEGDREFFKRHLQPVNETTIKTLLDEGAKLTATASSLRNGSTPIRNTGRHCDWCAFQEICTGDLLGNDTTPLKDDMR